MISSGQTSDEIGRSRHLEALFADEPYLSPTMKARQMHEKLLEQRASEGAPINSPVTPSLRIETREPVRSAGPATTPVRKTSGVPKMSFDEARAILRGHGTPDPYGFDPTDPLSYFRTQILSQWLEKVEPREINRPDSTYNQSSATPSVERTDRAQTDDRKD